MYGFHYFFKKSNLCLRTLFPHIKDNDFAFEILIFWLLKVYYWENREYRWKDATVFKKRLSITPASNDQSCKFSPIKQNSQRSQYIFIIHLLDILYDLKILFFLMDASHSWKKTRRHIPHSFLLKKKKKKRDKAQIPNIFWFYFLFGLSVSFLLKAIASVSSRCHFSTLGKQRDGSCLLL